MSWISGNLNELEDPIAKVNSCTFVDAQSNSWQGVLSMIASLIVSLIA